MLSVPWVGSCPLTRTDFLACFALRWKEGFQRDFPIREEKVSFNYLPLSNLNTVGTACLVTQKLN